MGLKQAHRGFLVACATVLALTALDVRDLLFKSFMIGPYDSFSFESNQQVTLGSTLTPSQSVDSIESYSKRPSGWLSLFSKCKSLRATSSEHLVLASNCTIGGPVDQYTPSQVVLSASLQVDVVAWASCKLLTISQRPSLCQEPLVTSFLRRYHMEDSQVGRDDIAPVGSEAEGELVRLLRLISQSAPSYRVVCVEGYEMQNPALSSEASFVGCASPTHFSSAFAGHHAKAIQKLVDGKSWLSMDLLNLASLDLVIRRNSKATIQLMRMDAGSDELHYRERINFSSSGTLFNALIMLDAHLLFAHLTSAQEILKVALWSSLSGNTVHPLIAYDQEVRWSFWPRLLYRNSRIILTTVAVQMLQWFFIQPFSVIWMSTSGLMGKLHVVLTVSRVWSLLLIGFNAGWSLIVMAFEQRAYRAARSTYVTTPEFVALVGFVLCLQLHHFRELPSLKYGLEKQRLWDTTSFIDHVLVANAMNDEQDFILSTDFDIVYLIYTPLLRLFVGTCIATSLYAVVKAVVLVQLGKLPLQAPSGLEKDGYERSPLEHLLGAPVRARSIIRCHFHHEQCVEDHLELSAGVLLDYGVIMDATLDETGTLRARSGFWNTLPPRVDVSAHFAPDLGSAEKKDIGLTSLLGDQDDASETMEMRAAGNVQQLDGMKKKRPSLHVPLR